MMIFRLALIFLLLAISGRTQATEVRGVATTLIGYEVRLLKQSDPFSGMEEVLDRDTISSEGDFSLETTITSTMAVTIAVNRFEATLFIEPEKIYELVIPDQPEFSLIKSWRPFEFEYFLENLDSTDINGKIVEFDRSYYQLYSENARLIGTAAFRKKVGVFAKEHPSEDGYFGDYVAYSIAELKLSNGFPIKGLYMDHLDSSDPKFENPAFVSFFDKFYADYFNRMDMIHGGATMPDRLNSGLSYAELDSMMKEDEFLVRDEIRQWVILKSIAENLYSRAYPTKPLLDLLEDITAEAKTNEIKQAGASVLQLYKERNRPVLLASLPISPAHTSGGKPGILAIGHLDSKEFTREKSILDDLLEKYGEYFSVFMVYLSASVENPVPEVLHRTLDESELVRKLDIRSFPWYGWVNEDGFVIERSMAKPSEGLESRLYAIRAKEKEEEKIKIGQ